MNCLLLCDSWNSNRNNDIFYEVTTEFPEIKVKRILIPPGTTGTASTQPLDVFFFRPYKVFSDSLELAKSKYGNNYFKLFLIFNSKHHDSK